ncbi:MAG: proton-conducting transporter membrane subunit [Bacteroidota bacterium]
MQVERQLNNLLNDLESVSLEAFLMLGAIAVLLVGLFTKRSLIIKSIFFVVIVFGMSVNLLFSRSGDLMLGSLYISENSTLFSSLFLLACLSLLVFERKDTHACEFYFMIIALLLGSIFMMEANNLLIVFLAVELASFSSYVLTNFDFKKSSYEAGIKYLLFGAICSAFMLFGIAFLYGSSGSIYFHEWGTDFSDAFLFQVGSLLFLIGLFFKISLAPFHIWVPSTYQTAPADAVAVLSILPKIAGIVLLQRFLISSAMLDLSWLFDCLCVLGMLTIVIGTVGAFRQSNVRRMIGFGAIAHSGFMLPFALLRSESSAEAFWWYGATYTLMNLLVFYLLHLFESKNSYESNAYQTKDYTMATAITIVMISLVGIPPLAGFTAKFFLFNVLWENYQLLQQEILLYFLLVAVLLTVGSLFYYLRVPANIFLKKPENPVSFSFKNRLIASFLSVVLLILFFVPDLLFSLKTFLLQRYE